MVSPFPAPSQNQNNADNKHLINILKQTMVSANPSHHKNLTKTIKPLLE